MGVTCSVDGCGGGVWSRGWCGMHYQRWRKHGTLDKVSRPRPVRQPHLLPCAVDGCDRKVKALGWCGMHYQRWTANGTLEKVRARRPPGICSFPGCDDPDRQRGLCFGHLAQLRSGTGELKTKRGDLPPRLCQFENCDRKHARHGWCAMHAMQFLTGRPMHEIGQRPKKHRSVTKHGYVLVYRPEHPNAYKSGWVLEHAVVMSELLGRALRKPEENVHHINGDRGDNRPENLELWNTHQPRGQRVDDKVEWAIELLRLYRPDALQ